MRGYRYKYGNVTASSRMSATIGDYLMRETSRGFEIATKDLINRMVFTSFSPDTIVEGESWRKWYGLGSSISQTTDNADKTLTVTFASTSLGLEMTVDVTYKRAVSVENEGLEAYVEGKMGFTKDLNVHVEGDAVCAGFMPNPDSWLYGGDENFFGLYTDYGAWQPHHVINEDASYTRYKTQERTTGEHRSLKLTVLNSVAPVRALLQPDGKDATYILTVHADGQASTSLRAVMHGANDTEHADYGIKGMISRGLVATWSMHAVGDGFENADMMAIMTEMHNAGFEICNHALTNDGSNDTRAFAIEQLPNFETHFGMRNWIDHSLGSGKRTCGMSSLGWDSDYPLLYIMDLLEDMGVEYAWAYIDSNQTNKSKVFDKRFAFPHDIVYQNPHLKHDSGEPMWLWTTSYHAMNDYLLSDDTYTDKIDEWIDGCSVVIDHDYTCHPAQVGNTITELGVNCKITPRFDNVLTVIQSRKASGKLWMPTMAQFGDYYRQLLKTSIEIGDNTATITNTGSAINGYTMLIGGITCIPKINNVEISHKSADKGTICWADIPNGVTTITW